jgi:hypothetical protein
LEGVAGIGKALKTSVGVVSLEGAVTGSGGSVGESIDVAGMPEGVLMGVTGMAGSDIGIAELFVGMLVGIVVLSSGIFYLSIFYVTISFYFMQASLGLIFCEIIIEYKLGFTFLG